MGLIHEFGHALQPLSPKMWANEERRVLESVEIPVARELGEDARTNHKGNHLIARDPTSRVPGLTNLVDDDEKIAEYHQQELEQRRLNAARAARLKLGPFP